MKQLLYMVLMFFSATAISSSYVNLSQQVFNNAAYFTKPKTFRSTTGHHNNTQHPDWGSAGSFILRRGDYSTLSYVDGKTTPFDCGHDCRLNARHISQQVCFDPTPQRPIKVNAPQGISDFFWLWGQFLDHDIVHTDTFKREVINGYGRKQEVTEKFPIIIPFGDFLFDEAKTGTETLPFDRSDHGYYQGVRFQKNGISAFIDASNVYGSNRRRARALRQTLRNGHASPYLRVSAGPKGPLLPYNNQDLPNATDKLRGHDKSDFFLAGDVRANEQVTLTALHTIFVREHNFIVDAIIDGLQKAGLPPISSEKLYHLARMVVGAELQVITYRDWLPLLLGVDRHRGGIPAYPGYNAHINPGIGSLFSTAAFRFGHSMVSPNLAMLNKELEPAVYKDGKPVGLGVREIFFHKVPPLLKAGFLPPLMRGMAKQSAQNIDLIIAEDLRNFLFGPPLPRFVSDQIGIPKGLDLAALNIQRGRDHGIPLYNTARALYGLAPARTFADISLDPKIQERLASVYASVHEIDAWVGGLAEDHVEGAMVGPLNYAVISDQFRRLRDGDSFWYTRHLPDFLIAWVENQSLSTILKRNVPEIGDEIGDNVFITDSVSYLHQ